MEGVDRDISSAGRLEKERKMEMNQAAIIICEGTVNFCERFIVRRSPTVAQMIDASRDAMRHISKGRRMASVSPQIGLSLLREAQTRLEELLVFYEDFLLRRDLAVWGEDHPQATAIRKLVGRSARSYGVYRTFVQNAPQETAANALICLIRQARLLLCQQIDRLQVDLPLLAAPEADADVTGRGAPAAIIPKRADSES